jgi:hypothetical protein
MQHFTKKILAGILGITLSFSAVFGSLPNTAHAGGAPVFDALNLIENAFTAIKSSAQVTKDYILDTLVWEVGNLAIQSMTRSIVNWINSGFQGSPAFVTDLNQNLRGVQDAVARRFFDSLATQDITQTVGQDRVLDAVRLAYYLRTSPESFYTRYPVTLGEVSPDPESYLAGDFSQGGWNAWFETVMNPQNNPFGANDLLNRELDAVVSNATNNRIQELSWNRGFLSWRGECQQYGPGGGQPPPIDSELDGAPESLGSEDNCVAYAVRTPGSVIMEQLNDRLGDNVNRLVSADEFNEIVGALLNQLVLQVLGGGEGGGGLAGVSQPTSGGGSSFINRATQPSAGSNIGATFATTVRRQLEQLREFQTNWERIRSAAQGALSRCGTNGNPNPQEVIDRAAGKLTKAADAIAAVEAIQQEIEDLNALGGNQSAALMEISARYSALVDSDTLPTAEEIGEAKAESLDTGDVEPGSLYSQMTRMSTGSCSAS